MEAPPGFEPGMEVLQTSALPLGYGAGRDVGWASMRTRLHGGAATAGQPSPQPTGEGWLASRSSRQVLLARERRLERETGFEPATSTLARSHSTTELFPLTSRTTAPRIPPNRCFRRTDRTTRLSGRST